jgi:hypothetical protein
VYNKQFVPARKRYALWKAHEGKCYYCREPLRYAEVWVDHILPASLAGDSIRLSSLLQEFGLEQNFDLNDYGNWLPSHPRCNQRKSDLILERGIALYYIGIASSKANTARIEEDKSRKNLKGDKLLGSLQIAMDEGVISKSDIQYIVSNSILLKDEPTVITFGLLIETVLVSDQAPDNVSTDYPHLCDWLEKDLIRHLQSITNCGFFYTEPSLRTGESLSVRLAFVDLDENELAGFSSAWWEILEFAPFSAIYGDDDPWGAVTQR